MAFSGWFFLMYCIVHVEMLDNPFTTRSKAEWGESYYCPLGTFVVGVRINIDPYDGPYLAGKDDVAIGGLDFYCGPIPQVINGATPGRVQTQLYVKRDWSSDTLCNSSFVTGFVVGSAEQRPLHNDKLGATSLSMCCDGDQVFEMGYPSLGSKSGGPQKCPTGQGVYGIQTEGMTWQTRKRNIFNRVDNVGLTDLKVFCRPIPSLDESCTPYDKWVKEFEYSNLDSPTDADVTFTKRKGVGRADARWENSSSSTTVTGGVSVGIGLPINLPAAKARIQTAIGVSNRTGYDWGSASDDTWQEETSISVKQTVPAGRGVRIRQVVAYCGEIKAFSERYVTEWYPDAVETAVQRRRAPSWFTIFLASIAAILFASLVLIGIRSLRRNKRTATDSSSSSVVYRS